MDIIIIVCKFIIDYNYPQEDDMIYACNFVHVVINDVEFWKILRAGSKKLFSSS